MSGMQNIYSDIAVRTGGDIYIGVVGPVRTGKSTFIKRFMEELVLPNMNDSFERERAKDEMPQTASGKIIGQSVNIGGTEQKITCVSMGSPHCVVFYDKVEGLDINSLGKAFLQSPIFPEGVNTEFVRVIDSTTIKMRVYEKVCGETFACGTGACAAVVAACENGYCEKGKDITVKLNGGDLVVNYKNDGVTLSGDAKFVYDGVTEY